MIGQIRHCGSDRIGEPGHDVVHDGQPHAWSESQRPAGVLPVAVFFSLGQSAGAGGPHGQGHVRLRCRIHGRQRPNVIKRGAPHIRSRELQGDVLGMPVGVADQPSEGQMGQQRPEFGSRGRGVAMEQGGDLLGAEPAPALIDVATAARRLLSVFLVDPHGLASVAPPVEPFDEQRGAATREVQPGARGGDAGVSGGGEGQELVDRLTGVGIGGGLEYVS